MSANTYPLSGATSAEWRDVSHHSTDNAPLDRVNRRTRSVWQERGELAGLLAVAAVLFLWQLGDSGYANDFYAAAVQAGTQSWKALFFGSFDSSNFITVDKPPLSLWPMEISGRVFGFGSWSMLVPQAIEGVLTVWLLYATVKRRFGHRAGLLAGALLALTPVAVLMFRFNNPDAAMVLLVVLAAYCTTRALEAASTTWIVLAGLVMGLSFLAKGLQPFTVLPALALAYLLAAPASWKRRVLQLLGAGVGIVVGAGWWVLAVDLTPAADRPYIGGSGNNSALGLAFGYNGLSRISGGSGGGAGGGGGGFDGTTGIGRMFNSLNGGQIAWLLPAALIALVALLAITRRAPLADATRAAAILWGGWLIVTGAVLSYASGIIHTYYTIELAPAIAALVAIGATVLWRMRSAVQARVAMAAAALVTGIWTFRLLDRAPDFHPWIRWAVVVVAIAAALGLLVPAARLRWLTVAAAVGALLALGGGSAAYAIDTVGTPHTGSTPTAGPTVSGGGGFGGGGFGGGGFGGGAAGGRRGGFPGAPGGTAGGGAPGGTTGGTAGTAPTGGTGRTGGAAGGGTTSADSAISALLAKTTSKWAAATIGSQTAGPLELATGKAVMAIGGFSGTDAAPTLTQFEAYVQAGDIRYFISGGGGFGGGGRGGGTSSAITQWVEANYTATTVGGSTVYDLTKASTS